MTKPTLIFVLVVLVTATASAGSAGRCEHLFVPKRELVPVSALPDYPTAKISEVILKRAGEEFLHIEKLDPSMPWGSRYAPRGYDPQGDPSQIFEVLGPDLSFILGFSRNEKGDLIAPTPETYNRRIYRFNRFLMAKNIAPIAVSFYSQAQPKLESYLRHWAQLLQIPIASGNTTRTIHDVVDNYSAVLLPVAVVKLLSIQSGLAWQWLHYGHDQALPKLAINSARRIDHISTSAGIVPGVDNSPYLRYWKSLVPDDRDPSMPAQMKTHLDVFRERLTHYNRHSGDDSKAPVFEDLPKATAPFFKMVKDSFPEWDRPMAAIGLRDYETLDELYTARAVELRYAARLYRTEGVAK